MTRMLYTGAMGMFTAKVCSWCVSRLGGSAAWATRSTPPRCGFSSARAHGAAHNPTHSTTANNSTCILQLLIIIPSSQHLPPSGSTVPHHALRAMAELRIQGVAQRIAKEISVSPLRAYPSKDVTAGNSAILSAYGDRV